MMGRKPTTRLFIESYIKDPIDTDECITLPNKSYPTIRWDGKMQSVSRLVLTEIVGPPPTDKHMAAHKPSVCHNTRCINVKHLSWKTQSENESDKVLDGTNSIGSRNGNFKLTDEQVLDIYYDLLLTHRELAALYNVDSSVVTRIKNGEAWSWLTGHKK